MTNKVYSFLLLVVCLKLSFTVNFDADSAFVEKSMISSPKKGNKFCVLFYVNARQLERFKYTYEQLRSNGCYTGDVVLFVCDDLDVHELRKQPIFNTVNLVKFKNIKPIDDLYKTFHSDAYKIQPHINKFYVFHEFFKQWDFVFYIDCGMTIFRPIQEMIDLKEKGLFLAHSDAYPTYEWTLRCQFSREHKPSRFNHLKRNFNLNEDYPQVTIMLYDTSIITKTTISELIHLMHEFPISRTNDQAYFALYLTQIKKVWKQIPLKNEQDLYFYDWWSRNPSFKYIMTKY